MQQLDFYSLKVRFDKNLIFFDKNQFITIITTYHKIIYINMVTVVWKTSKMITLPKTFVPLTASNMGEIYYESLPKTLRLNEFFKIFTDHYVTKINDIIGAEISVDKNDMYDEVLVFQLNSDHIELLNYPIFTLVSREEEEGFEYMKDANRILKLFKMNYFGKKEDQIFNTPILLENAPGTEFDIMIVIGGKNSSNTKQLHSICLENCSDSYLIENENELNDSWFLNKKLCGVTAGASTPDWIIQQVINKIESNE